MEGDGVSRGRRRGGGGEGVDYWLPNHKHSVVTMHSAIAIDICCISECCFTVLSSCVLFSLSAFCAI